MPDPSPDVILVFWFSAVSYVIALCVICSMYDGTEARIREDDGLLEVDLLPADECI